LFTYLSVRQSFCSAEISVCHRLQLGVVMSPSISFKIKWKMSLETLKNSPNFKSLHQISCYQTGAVSVAFPLLANLRYTVTHTADQWIIFLLFKCCGSYEFLRVHSLTGTQLHPVLKNRHLCVTQAPFHVITHYAHAGVIAWLLKTPRLYVKHQWCTSPADDIASRDLFCLPSAQKQRAHLGETLYLYINNTTYSVWHCFYLLLFPQTLGYMFRSSQSSSGVYFIQKLKTRINLMTISWIETCSVRKNNNKWRFCHMQHVVLCNSVHTTGCIASNGFILLLAAVLTNLVFWHCWNPLIYVMHWSVSGGQRTSLNL
jgi:hypothetical protein